MTYSMSTAAARKASKKTQHVRSAGDWITLILLVAGALLVLFPLLVLTVNAFKTSADYNATGPLSLPKHFTMEGIISFWTTTNFPLKFWNSFIISLVVAVAAVVLSVLELLRARHRQGQGQHLDRARHHARQHDAPADRRGHRRPAHRAIA